MAVDLDRVVLRPANDYDFWYTYELKKAALREYVTQVWGWEEEFQRDFHKREFTPDGTDIIVYDDRNIGLVRIEREPDHIYVRHLYIHPEAQGQGIGSHIMRRIIEEGGEKHLPVRLHVLKVNRRARGFYEKLGFVVYAETDTHHGMHISPC